MEDFITIELGSSFLLNAGIRGLLKLLSFVNAEEGQDYQVERQSVNVSKRFIMEHNLADAYVKTMVGQMKKGTRFYEILQKRSLLEQLYEGKEVFEKKELDQIQGIYKEFVQMLEKNSFAAGYVILDEYEGVRSISKELITALKKEKDPMKQKEYYLELCDRLAQPEVEEVLIFKELMYSKLNMFYEGTSFFLPGNLKKDIKECYHKDFIQPLLEELTTAKKKKKRCIECSNLVTDTKSISFMLDTTDDVNRKKSHYWNQKPDAFVCPVCAFLYTLVPLGFQFLGRDAIFINDNSSVKRMMRLMGSYEIKIETNAHQSSKSRLYRAFISEKEEMLFQKTNNLQVVVRSKDKDHYELNVLGKDMVQKLHEGRKYLTWLEPIYLKMDGKNYVSIFDAVFDNILQKRSQYALIHRLFQFQLGTGGNTNFLKSILELHVLFQGGEHMEDLQKNVQSAWMAGVSMREALTQTVKEKDIDNHLRGFVYQLSNALSVGNRQQFLDLVIRIYSSKGMPIPYIFKLCFHSEEMFRGIGQGYILGLKYARSEKNATD